jgi:ornithine carbamoyltransferase
MRHLLEIDDLTKDELFEVIALALDPNPPQVLSRKGMALVFQKPSARTRNSMEMAVKDLGGHPVTIRAEEVSIDQRESAEDVARTLACYHAAIGARVFDHSVLERMAKVAWVPIINLLSDDAHPCQTLADLLTMRQEWGSLDGRTVAWIGDFNNVARSLSLGLARCGMRLRVASPNGYGPSDEDVDRMVAAGLPEAPVVTDRPLEAVEGADAVHTDIWASMGQEDQADVRHRAFEGFQVDERVMAAAPSHAVFMHCLPAHRGEEIAAAVVDGPQSRVFPQAHNRLHAFRGLLRLLLETSP